MSEYDFDVIIVGAGPAGSTAAHDLAKSGAKVLLLDKEKFPRYKACGGGIPIRTEKMLPFPIDSVIEDSVHLLRVSALGKHSFTRDCGEPFAHMVLRNRFDNLLLEQAQITGAEFRPKTTIQDLKLTKNGVVITAEHFTASSKFLICADGAHSPVGKLAGLGTTLAECAAWEVDIQAKYQDIYPKTSGATALIDIGFQPWGYAWMFPKAEVLSIGIVTPRSQASKMKKRIQNYLEHLHIADYPIDIAKGHKIRFRRNAEQIAKKRIALIGDAAGLADEFTQEGISYAIHSGKLVAKSLISGENTDPLKNYENAVDQYIQPELNAARLISFMFQGMLQRFQKPWMFATGHAPFLWKSFFEVQRGNSTYDKELKKAGPLGFVANQMLQRNSKYE